MPITTPLHKVKGLPKFKIDTAQARVSKNLAEPKVDSKTDLLVLYDRLKHKIELDYACTRVLPDKLQVDSLGSNFGDIYADLAEITSSRALTPQEAFDAIKKLDVKIRSLEISLLSGLKQKQTFTGRTVLRYRESQLRETRTEILNDTPRLLRRYSFIQTGVERLYAVQYGTDEQTKIDKDLLRLLANDVQRLLTAVQRGQLETYKILKRRIENYQYLHTSRGVELSQPVVSQLDDVFQAADFLEEKRQSAIDKLNKGAKYVGKFIGVKEVNLYNAFRVARGAYRVGRGTKRALQNLPSYLREGLSNLRDIHNLAAQALPYPVRRIGSLLWRGTKAAARLGARGAKAASIFTKALALNAKEGVLNKVTRGLRNRDSNFVGRFLRKKAVYAKRNLRRSRISEVRQLAKLQETPVEEKPITTQAAAEVAALPSAEPEVPETSALGELEKKYKKKEKKDAGRKQHAESYKTIIQLLTSLTADVRRLESKIVGMPSEIVQPIAAATTTSSSLLSRTFSALKEIQLKPLVQSIVQMLSLPSNKRAIQQRIEPTYGITSETQQAANDIAAVEDKRLRHQQTESLHVIAENAKRPRDSFGTLLSLLMDNPIVKGLLEGTALTAGITGLGSLVVAALNTEVGKHFVSWAADMASKVGNWVYDGVESYFSKKALDALDRHLNPTTTSLTESGKVTALGVDLDKLAPTTKAKFSNLLTHVQNLGISTPDVHSISADGYAVTMPSATINAMEKSGLLEASGFVRTTPTTIRDSNVRKSYPSETRSLFERLTDYNATLDTASVESKASRMASGRVTPAVPSADSISSMSAGLGSASHITQPKLVTTQADKTQKTPVEEAAKSATPQAAAPKASGTTQANSVLSIPTFSWNDGSFFFLNLGHLAR